MYSASLLSGIHEKTNPFLYSPTSATDTGWERTPLARDAAGGVGDVGEG
jgi:hypothetical protein